MAEPVAIDNVKAPGGGRIGLVHCPGTAGYGLAQAEQRAALDVDLATLREWGAESLVTLLQPFEMDLLGVEGIGEQWRQAGLEWWHLPIHDGCAPDRSFEEGWERAGPALHSVLDGGGRIVLHCRAGVGRTGTIGARLLIERGIDAGEAVRAIRRARPGSIESPEQMTWIRRLRTR